MECKVNHKKVALKPKPEWTHEDRICVTSMESTHGGTWRPAVCGCLVRVSRKPRLKRPAHQFIHWPMELREWYQDFLALGECPARSAAALAALS